jgi:hypothetical protein
MNRCAPTFGAFIKRSCWLILIGTMILIPLVPATYGTTDAATDLTLAPNLSFTDDSSPNFPIDGEDLADAAVAHGLPTVMFFGTSNCWNTAREAERLVALYPRYRKTVHFLVIDLRHPSPAQQRLANQYYSGYIPTLAIFDNSGRLIYDRAGETASKRGDFAHLQELIDSVLRQKVISPDLRP